MSDTDGNGFADSELFYFSTSLVMNFNNATNDNSELYSGVNAALQYLLRSEKAQSLHQIWAEKVCSLNDGAIVEEDVTSIQLKHLSGPFAVHFIVGLAIILYSILKHVGTWLIVHIQDHAK
jgi:hypothetical protein